MPNTAYTTSAFSERRRIARLDFALRVLNGGRLPGFDVYIDEQHTSFDVVWPYDGTPETALAMVRAQFVRVGRRCRSIGLTLAAGSADALIAACPEFYQGITMWREDF